MPFYLLKIVLLLIYFNMFNNSTKFRKCILLIIYNHLFQINQSKICTNSGIFRNSLKVSATFLKLMIFKYKKLLQIYA